LLLHGELYGLCQVDSLQPRQFADEPVGLGIPDVEGRGIAPLRPHSRA
jgi:hypothetical protein